MGNPLALGLPGLIPWTSRTCWLFWGKTGIPGPNTTVLKGALGLLPLIGFPGAGRPYPGVGRHAQDEYRMSPGACRVSQRGSRLALDDNGAPLDAHWGSWGLQAYPGRYRMAQEGHRGSQDTLQRPLKAMGGSLCMPWLQDGGNTLSGWSWKGLRSSLQVPGGSWRSIQSFEAGMRSIGACKALPSQSWANEYHQKY